MKSDENHGEDVAGSRRGRIAAGTGSRIALGQVPGRDRIVPGQDRSGIRLQDRCGGRIVAAPRERPGSRVDNHI